MIIRVKKTRGYTVICNSAINDKRLSFKAKGLHTYLMSKPDNWRPAIEELISASKDSRDAVRSAIKELEKCGFVLRKRVNAAKGKFWWEYSVFESPQDREAEEKNDEQPSTENPSMDVQPSTGFPSMGKPSTENPTLISTNLISTELTSTKENGASVDDAIIVSAENGIEPGAQPMAGKDEYSDEFRLFWSEYPRKKEKKKAYRQWGVRLKEKIIAADMIKAAKNYAEECKVEKTEARFIKHPATFIGPDKPFADYIDWLPPEPPDGERFGRLTGTIEGLKTFLGRRDESGNERENSLVDNGYGCQLPDKARSANGGRSAGNNVAASVLKRLR